MARSVLGIDAAWTLSKPSGVALVVEKDDRWTLSKVSSSYAEFTSHLDLTTGDDAGDLIRAAREITGIAVTLVAADIPLARMPIVARRYSDDRVSEAYGARHASTHSPNAQRPGKISSAMRDEFVRQGYPLSTTELATPALIEVYPHPALIELTSAERRLPYKEGKVAKYWPHLSATDRRTRLLEQWSAIVEHLEARIAGVTDALLLPDTSVSRKRLKAFEDALDAVVCAWVGTCALDGQAMPFGDESSAIWVPMRSSTTLPAPRSSPES